MEIKYEQFNKWNLTGRALNYWTDEEHNFILSDKVANYFNGIAITLDPDEEQLLTGLIDKFNFHFDIMTLLGEWKNEINLNIANIPGADQVTRYLTFIKNEINITLAFLDESLHFDRLEESKTNYNNFSNCNPIHGDSLSVLFRTFEGIKAGYENILEYVNDLLFPISPEEPLTMDNGN